MVADIIKKIGRSLVQHGPYNRRVYLMKLDAQDMPHILPVLDRLAQDNHYEKILTKVPSSSKAAFKKQGYVQEAVISEYFDTQEHAVFMCKYLSSDRKKTTDHSHIQEILSLSKQRKQHPKRQRKYCGLQKLGAGRLLSHDGYQSYEGCYRGEQNRAEAAYPRFNNSLLQGLPLIPKAPDVVH